MHILYLHQHFALPSGSTGTRSYELARRWIAAGHKVTLICGRGDICGLPDKSRFQVEGINIRVVGAEYSHKQSFLRRICAFLMFMIDCTLQGVCVRKVDIIFATSTPLTIGIPAMLLKWFKRVPFVFEVRDQWPQVPIQMGYIRNPFVIKLVLLLEKSIYRSAAAIVALSPGMAEGVRQVLGTIDKSVRIAPNSADVDLFHPGVDGTVICRQMGWQDKFVVMHFGTIGHANGLKFLLDAAEKCLDQKQILFVLIGSGREKQSLQQIAEERKLANIQFVENQPKKDLPKWVAACDVSTVIFADYPILEHNSANKFFDSLAAGKPVLLNYSGWQHQVLEENKAGLGCRRCDLNDYLDKLKWMLENKDCLPQMGQNARTLAELKFSRDKIAADVLDVLKNVFSSSSFL